MSASEVTILVARVVAREHTRNPAGWRHGGATPLRALSYDERNLGQAGVPPKNNVLETEETWDGVSASVDLLASGRCV
jgi:hypothetical protein